MSPTDAPDTPATDELQEPPPPAAVLTFHAADPTGAGGSPGDVATITAMGAHPLPVITAILVRDTAEVFEHVTLEPDTVVEQARGILEDVTISAVKIGFLGNAEGVSTVAEIVSDYPDVPVVTYLSNLGWIEDEDDHGAYHDALRELVLPLTEVLVGNQKTLTDFLLPEWDAERPPSARELAVAAHEHGAGYVLVTGVQLPTGFVDNVLASPQGAITGEKFERFEAAFVGAGDTLSAALASLLAGGQELHIAATEALNFLDQTLDAGFRPGMGHVVPDRFFWAAPPEEGEEGEGGPQGGPDDGPDEPITIDTPATPRNVH